MLTNYMDDTDIAYQNEAALREFLDSLAKNGFEYTKEGSFTEYLGIQYVKDTVQTGRANTDLFKV